MTVAHIAWQYGETNTGGAALSATRLHLALLARGIDSHYVCVHNREGEESLKGLKGLKSLKSEENNPQTFKPSNSQTSLAVHELPRGILRKVYLSLTKLTRVVWRFTKYHRSISINAVPLFGLEAELKKIKPDIVHIQWINADVCAYEQLAKLPYKLVFNLHDLYMLCGFDVHPGDDPRFEEGYTRANSSRLETWLFNRKRRLVEKTNPSFIADSRWVESMCRRSFLGRNRPVRAIYNLPDALFLVGTLKPSNSQTFKLSNSQTFKLLFGCYGGLTNHFKGFPDLLKAFEFLTPEERSRLELRVFGSKELARSEAEKCEKLGIRMVNLGIPSNEDLRKEYLAADLFLFPSVKETIGMTKVEALFCGTPVVAFERTACAEGIIHGETGWIAPDGDCQSYAEGIRHCLAHPVDRATVVAKTAEIFSSDKILNDVLDVYTQSLC